jgi:hypothetical protein
MTDHVCMTSSTILLAAGRTVKYLFALRTLDTHPIVIVSVTNKSTPT